LNIPGLACLLLLLSACTSKTVKPGASFRPTHYADNNHPPPEINRLAKIEPTELSRLSQGLPITIYQHGDKTPLHVAYKTKHGVGQYG